MASSMSPEMSIIENLWRDLARAVYAKGGQLSNMNKLKNGNYSGMGKNIKRTNYEALSYITSAEANDYNRKKSLEVLQNIKY